MRYNGVRVKEDYFYGERRIAEVWPLAGGKIT